ncbi:MAG: PepSY domain-containing protein [Gammaproteobacteria bacterium]|nr:PepSY domain-containing protein [Gammaproteobacteria bacterium]
MLKSNSLTCLLCRFLEVGRQMLGLAVAPTLKVLLMVLLTAPLLGAPDAQAQQGLLPQQGDAPREDRRGQNAQPAAISQRQALDLVRASYPGNVVSINEVQQGGGLFYRVRMDNEGNIYTLYVDAATGAITREQ